MTTEFVPENNLYRRLQSNKHFARDIRQRLTSRHALGTAMRSTLDAMSDQELVEVWMRHEKQEREHAAKQLVGEGNATPKWGKKHGWKSVSMR